MLLLEKNVATSPENKVLVNTINQMYSDMVVKYVDANSVDEILSEVTLNYIHVFFNDNQMFPIYITPFYCIVPIWSSEFMDSKLMYQIQTVMQKYRETKGIKSIGKESSDTHYEIDDTVCLYAIIASDYYSMILAKKVRMRYDSALLNLIPCKPSFLQRIRNYFFGVST